MLYNLVLLQKTAVPSSVTDFRPIALLSFLSKVLEKIVYTQITEYLRDNKILNPYQTGFRQNHSTQTALLKLTEDIRAGVDERTEKKLITILLLFDFSKAFDTISPSRLLRKLISIGFSRAAVKWLKPYITEREQKVITTCNGQSDWLTTNLGVPQGSVLESFLFSLYINDLADILDFDNISHILYTEYLQIYTHSQNRST